MRDKVRDGGGGVIMEEVGQVNNGDLHGVSSPTARGVSTWVSHGDRQHMKRGMTISGEE